MTYYQETQFVLAAFDALLVIGLLVYSLWRDEFPPVVAFATLVGMLGCVFFLVSFLAADQSLPRTLQVAIKLLRDLPVVLIVGYVCLLQARKYALIRGHGSLRYLFLKCPRVLLACYGLGAMMEFAFRPPVLDSDAGLPPLVLVSDAVILAPLIGYAGASGLVFFLTALKKGGRLSNRLQNLCGTLALGGIAVLGLHTSLWRAIRVMVPSEDIGPYVQQLSTNQVVIVAVVASSVAGGIVLYLIERVPHRAHERLANYLDALASSPPAPSRWGASTAVPYHAMRRASREDLLDLSSTQKDRAEALFHLIVAHHAQADGDGRLRAILRDFETGCDAEVVPSRQPPEALSPRICLTRIALADACLIPSEYGASAKASQPEVSDAYWLARYEIENSGPSIGGGGLDLA